MKRRREPIGVARQVRAPGDPTEGIDVDRLMVFVPAIMSIGLLFSLATLLRDLLRWTGSRARERRTTIETATVINDLLDEGEPPLQKLGVLSRPAYLITALVLAGGAVYIAIGSTANFMRDGGYVRDIGWLLAVSLGLALVLGFIGGVAMTVFLTWPRPAPWTLGTIRAAPLTINPNRPGAELSWTYATGVALSAVSTVVITLIVASGRSIANDIDAPVARWIVEADWIDRIGAIDPFGQTIFSVALVIVIGLSAFRCKVMALTYPVAFGLGWLTTSAVRELVERPRPTVFGDFESFPSGHLVQATFVAGLVPLAVGVLLLDRRVATLARAVLAVAVAGTALHRIHQQHHWPLDSLAGITLGLVIVLSVHWVMEQRHLHRSCGSCPWSGHPGSVPWRRGVLRMSEATTDIVGRAGAVLALGAAAGLATLTVLIGLPTDPEGFGLASSASGPIQLGLAALMALSALLALRWRASAALLMAFAACGLGLFSSVQYRPLIAIGLTALLLVPAIVTWLAWQPTETVASIAALAVFTASALSGTAIGADRIYDHYFGPTHPESSAPERDDNDGRWFWLGAVTPRSATVVVGGLGDGETAELAWWGEQRSGTVETTADGGGVARFTIDELWPRAEVAYRIETEADGADGPPDGTIRTPGDGAQDLVVVLGSCARSGSNGAVFDAIVGERPDLYLALGDLHYANLESSNPDDHLAQYGRALTQPGQAVLFASTPTAYVWDDHDFGPNDADSSSLSRDAVSEAYRQAVPHFGVDPDPSTSIAQAFTVGRVRFVLTDTRSMRTAETMLGEAQLEWFIDELISSSSTHALVVWANPTPWISTGGTDDWSRFPQERQTIADAIVAAGVDNLIMVSGEAHMVAIDDGTNSGYASDGSRGFPLLHAGALDRPGSVKGGPYSEGAFPGAGHEIELEIEDDGGDSITVRLSGHTWEGRELTSLTIDINV